VPIEGALSLVIVRSPHAHARIARIDVDEARRLPGVAGVFSLADLPELRGALPPPVVPAVSVKMGFDPTAPRGESPERYNRVVVPGVDQVSW
jgi:CO/xanthine dehydrogenase Mo-binding subunit